MARHRSRNSSAARLTRVVGVIVVVGCALAYQWWERGAGTGATEGGGADGRDKGPKRELETEHDRDESGPGQLTTGEIQDGLAPQPKLQEPGEAPKPSGRIQQVGGFDVLLGANLAEHRNNDGDSFLVDHNGERHQIRLYFVDAPEKRLHQHNEERIGYQARYFSITPEETIKIGQDAKTFTQALLSAGEFNVYTKWEPVYDSDRVFGFVEVKKGKDSALLSEELTEHGLSRIYTQGKELPDGRSENEFKAHLRSIEAGARSAERGAWGLTSER